MNRTRALVIIGCFMLVLAVLAALDLRRDSPPSVATHEQMVTGTLDRHIVAGNTTIMPENSIDSSSKEEKLVSLESTTLRPSPMPAEQLPRIPDFVEHQAPLHVAQQQTEQPIEPIRKTQQEPSPLTSSSPIATHTSNLTSPPRPDITTKADSPHVAPPMPVPLKEQPTMQEKRMDTLSPKEKTQEKLKEQQHSKSKDQPKAKPEEKTQTLIMTTKGEEKLTSAQKAIKKTRLELGKTITFRIDAAAPLSVKTLLLESPDRYVVDLQGSWGITLPKIPKNLLLTEIRSGQRPEATRLVFGLKRKPESAQVVKIDAKTVEVKIK